MYTLFLILGVLIIAWVILRLLRFHKIKEKYVWLWLFLDLLALISLLFPSILHKAATLAGFEVTSNFALTIVLSVVVALALHQAVVVTGLEEDRRRLVEEIALLRHDVTELQSHLPNQNNVVLPHLTSAEHSPIEK
ncbi:DUF2304 domain-containing protein [Actinomyces vulturis]|uniref:DUF2304 domain-containing protein n=1 Tax=Actinomyces vulturis TaxID=1857645 RepID=UPI00082BA4A0|nr:DUF2304 domain-containing protein [Actinomyces vulturis]